MFDAADFIEEAVSDLKSAIDDVAIIACSGGVDSAVAAVLAHHCLLYTSPSPRDATLSRMPSSA